MIEVREGGLICTSDQFEGYFPNKENNSNSMSNKDKIRNTLKEYLKDDSYDYDCHIKINDDLDNKYIEGWTVIINDEKTEYITLEFAYFSRAFETNPDIASKMISKITYKDRHEFFNDIGLGNCERKLITLELSTKIYRALFEGIKV